MANVKKTNCIRILENADADFEVLSYDYDDKNTKTGELALHSAEILGIPSEQVFKTIVMKNEHNKIFVFCVSANSTVNLKKARNLTNSKEINSVKPEELLQLTGYVRGGCSPIGMKKQYETFIDESAILFDKIFVSAGLRGMNIKINAEELAKVCGAKFADLTL